MTVVRRHRWIYVRESARADIARRCRDEASRDEVLGCLARGWPLVARSVAPGDRPACQPAGLCLPLSLGRRRIALDLEPAQIDRVEEPAALASVANVLPAGGRAIAAGLAGLAADLGFTARAFGSAAWQWRTGEAYLTEASDLDLLVPARAPGLGRWLARLRDLDAASTLRLDGEVEDEAGDAVNWREWAGERTSVLVKSPSGARLVARAALTEAWR